LKLIKSNAAPIDSNVHLTALIIRFTLRSTMTAARTKLTDKPAASEIAAAGSHHAASGEDTRERLLKAATSLFSKKGFDGVSVKELADAAGVNVSLVSYHFGGKENLYRICLEQFGKERLALAQRVLQPPQTTDEMRFRLQMFVEEMLACHLENQDAAMIVHHECESELARAPDIFRDTFLKVFETMVAFVSAAQTKGLIRADLDPLVASQVFFGSMVHVLRSDKIGQKYFNLTIADPAYRKKIIDHIVRCKVFCIAEERRTS
jgi:AcrR family transcriptional regulator